MRLRTAGEILKQQYSGYLSKRPAVPVSTAVSSGSRCGLLDVTSGYIDSYTHARLSLMAQNYRLPPSADRIRALARKRTLIYRMPHRFKPRLHVYGVSGIVASMDGSSITYCTHILFSDAASSRSSRRCDFGTESTEVDGVHNYTG